MLHTKRQNRADKRMRTEIVRKRSFRRSREFGPPKLPKDVQNRQNFLNACGPWVQTGCNNADYDSSIEQAFSVWQPNVDLENTPTGQSKIDYLASKCGCFGSGTGGRSATCGSYTGKGETSCESFSECKWSSTEVCVDKNVILSCEDAGGVCWASPCPDGKTEIQAWNSYCANKNANKPKCCSK